MLIGIVGEMGSGKSTVADMLRVHMPNTYVIPFARPLKNLAVSMGWNGKKDKRGRRLLQLLGTDICRECIDPNWHTEKWLAEVKAISIRYPDPSTTTIIADDCRFLNEASTILASEGKIIRIVGRRNGIVKTSYDDFKDYFRKKHRSESELNKIQHDYWINNECDKLQLAVRVNTIVRKIQNG